MSNTAELTITERVKYETAAFINFYLSVFPDWDFPAHFFPVVKALMDPRVDKVQVEIGPGSGKGLAYGTPVFMSDGSTKPIEDIRVGDRVMCPDGMSSTSVIAVAPQPKLLSYLMHFSEHEPIVCNGPHLWKITRDGIDWQVVSTEFLYFDEDPDERPIFIPAYGNSGLVELIGMERQRDQESVCIQVTHPDGLFVAGDYIVTHNSQIISCIYPTFALGRNPKLSILGISAAENLVQGFQQSGMEIIEYSAAFKDFFPNVHPDKKAGWSVGNGIYLQERSKGTPDPSWFACGIGSSSLVGKHADVISIDDVHNEENTSTSKQCDSVTKVYYSTILGRAKPSGCKFVLAGRRWREDDLYGRLERSGEWVTMKLPVERKGAKQLYWDVVMAPDVVNIFSEEFKPDFQDKEGMMHYKVPYAIDPKGQGFFWPAMPQKRKEFMAVKKGDPATFEATYQCNPGNRESGVFLDSDFRYVDEMPTLQQCLAEGATIYQSWDTATGSSPKSDFSVCITAAFFPCEHYHHNEDRDLYGECDPHMDVYILDVYRENIEFAELFSAVKTQYQKWRPSTIVMEKKSSGISILQLARNIAPIEEVNPGAEGKRARATNTVGTGTASVQGWFRLGRVLFPRNAPWLEALTTELKDFSGDGSGKDDQVDALVYIVAAAIRLGGGGAMLPSNAEALANSTGDNNFYPDDKNGLQTALGSVFSVESVLDPFRMTCGKCKHLTQTNKCKFTGKSMINLDSCEKFDPKADNGWELMVI